MMRGIKLFSILILTLSIQKAWAQSPLLAKQLFQEEEFERASIIYEDLLKDQPNNPEYYENYLACLVYLDDYKNAKKLVRKYQKSSNHPMFRADEIWVLSEESGNDRKIQKIKESFFKDCNGQPNCIVFGARRLSDHVLKEDALWILKDAESKLGNVYNIANEIALLELQVGERFKALERYIEMMVRSNVQYHQLKQIIDTYVTDSSDIVQLQGILLKQVQKNPNVSALSEWLKWTFVSLQDWQKAFVFTRSLDQRMKEDGYRMFDLGFLCKTNLDLEMALQCFEYVVKKGPTGYNFQIAKSQWFEIKYELLLKSDSINSPKFNEYTAVLDSFVLQEGPSNFTLQPAIILSEIYIRSNKINSGIEILELHANSPYLNKNIRAQSKVALADALITTGDVYTSELLLAQVEKEFKDDPIGQQAKFKRAELSFYRGDYEWANMQLDVLKGATTQLISNDAMELSLCITDNLGIDSNYAALEMYSQARLFFRQQWYDSAMIYARKLNLDFPGHALGDEVLMLRAQIEEAKNNFLEAADLYQALAETYPTDILADNALYKLAKIQQYKLNNSDKAQEYYKKLIENHTDSIFIGEARIEYRKLRGF